MEKKKWHGIVERTSADGNTQQHWYFAESAGVFYVSGYREYQKQDDGSFIITARYYPVISPHLPLCITADEVPMPSDVLSEVAEKSGTRNISRYPDRQSHDKWALWPDGYMCEADEAEQMLGPHMARSDDYCMVHVFDYDSDGTPTSWI